MRIPVCLALFFTCATCKRVLQSVSFPSLYLTTEGTSLFLRPEGEDGQHIKIYNRRLFLERRKILYKIGVYPNEGGVFVRRTELPAHFRRDSNVYEDSRRGESRGYSLFSENPAGNTPYRERGREFENYARNTEGSGGGSSGYGQREHALERSEGLEELESDPLLYADPYDVRISEKGNKKIGLSRKSNGHCLKYRDQTFFFSSCESRAGDIAYFRVIEYGFGAQSDKPSEISAEYLPKGVERRSEPYRQRHLAHPVEESRLPHLEGPSGKFPNASLHGNPGPESEKTGWEVPYSSAPSYLAVPHVASSHVVTPHMATSHVAASHVVVPHLNGTRWRGKEAHLSHASARDVEAPEWKYGVPNWNMPHLGMGRNRHAHWRKNKRSYKKGNENNGEEYAEGSTENETEKDVEERRSKKRLEKAARKSKKARQTGKYLYFNGRKCMPTRTKKTTEYLECVPENDSPEYQKPISLQKEPADTPYYKGITSKLNRLGEMLKSSNGLVNFSKSLPDYKRDIDSKKMMRKVEKEILEELQTSKKGLDEEDTQKRSKMQSHRMKFKHQTPEEYEEELEPTQRAEINGKRKPLKEKKNTREREKTKFFQLSQDAPREHDLDAAKKRPFPYLAKEKYTKEIEYPRHRYEETREVKEHRPHHYTVHHEVNYRPTENALHYSADRAYGDFADAGHHRFISAGGAPIASISHSLIVPDGSGAPHSSLLSRKHRSSFSGPLVPISSMHRIAETSAHAAIEHAPEHAFPPHQRRMGADGGPRAVSRVFSSLESPVQSLVQMHPTGASDPPAPSFIGTPEPSRAGALLAPGFSPQPPLLLAGGESPIVETTTMRPVRVSGIPEPLFAQHSAPAASSFVFPAAHSPAVQRDLPATFEFSHFTPIPPSHVLSASSNASAPFVASSAFKQPMSLSSSTASASPIAPPLFPSSLDPLAAFRFSSPLVEKSSVHKTKFVREPFFSKTGPSSALEKTGTGGSGVDSAPFAPAGRKEHVQNAALAAPKSGGFFSNAASTAANLIMPSLPKTPVISHALNPPEGSERFPPVQMESAPARAALSELDAFGSGFPPHSYAPQKAGAISGLDRASSFLSATAHVPDVNFGNLRPLRVSNPLGTDTSFLDSPSASLAAQTPSVFAGASERPGGPVPNALSTEKGKMQDADFLSNGPKRPLNTPKDDIFSSSVSSISPLGISSPASQQPGPAADSFSSIFGETPLTSQIADGLANSFSIASHLDGGISPTSILPSGSSGIGGGELKSSLGLASPSVAKSFFPNTGNTPPGNSFEPSTKSGANSMALNIADSASSPENASGILKHAGARGEGFGGVPNLLASSSDAISNGLSFFGIPPAALASTELIKRKKIEPKYKEPKEDKAGVSLEEKKSLPGDGRKDTKNGKKQNTQNIANNTAANMPASPEIAFSEGRGALDSVSSRKDVEQHKAAPDAPQHTPGYDDFLNYLL